MSHDPKEVLDFVDLNRLTTAVGYDQEDRGWSKMAALEAEQEALRLHLSAALRLHGTRQDWPTLSDAVQDAAGVIRANRKTLAELHQILGTEPHESILDRAREVATALAEKEAALAVAHEALQDALRVMRLVDIGVVKMTSGNLAHHQAELVALLRASDRRVKPVYDRLAALRAEEEKP